MPVLPVAKVIVDIQVRHVDRVFDYTVPQHLVECIRPGHRVLVPFGHRRVEGFVVAYPAHSDLPNLKSVHKLLDDEPLLTPVALHLSHWMTEKYLCLLAQSLQCWLPAGVSLRRSQRAVEKTECWYHIDATKDQASLFAELYRAPMQRAALELILKEGGKLSASQARQAKLQAACQALVKRGIATSKQISVRRDLYPNHTFPRIAHPLTSHQRTAVNSIKSAVKQGAGRFLLHGVTGSGKTLVYLEAIAAACQLGKSAIVLVPEISLTPQAVAAFKGWFGDKVAVLHSRLSTSERADQWYAARRGEVQVVLGARSAVFAPLSNLGLIIVDEEQETAYKQEENPRYHAREIAEARANHEGAVLLLGSATPSLESYQRMLQGELTLLSLPERVDNRPLPEVTVVDMREELLAGNRSMFSQVLQQELHNCLAQKQQAILFLNRRGFASFVLCRACGATLGCNHCQVTLTYHEPDRLECHYCGERKIVPQRCPVCDSPYLRPFGAGTQRVQREVEMRFPQARVIRMDMDTTTRKGMHEKIWRTFNEGGADVLVGTQMVAKGLHFPGVTLVGVVCADTSLHFPDFRAAERTFQLLTQVAGRAGRGEESGKVIVQTYAPEHYSLQSASTHDYEGFAHQELAFRKKANYPPFAHLARVLITTDNEEEASSICGKLALICRSPNIEVIGPAPAPLSRLKDRFRWHILLKGEEIEVNSAAKKVLQMNQISGSQVIVDINPMSLL